MHRFKRLVVRGGLFAVLLAVSSVPSDWKAHAQTAEPGPQGPIGSGLNFVWVDADGGVVGPYVFDGNLSEPRGYLTMDQYGHLWGVDVETARLIPTSRVLQYYSDAGCTGVGYVSFLAQPRMVLFIGQLEKGFVRGDSQPLETGTVASYGDGITCISMPPQPIRGLRVDRLESATSPSTPFHRCTSSVDSFSLDRT